MHYRSVPSRSGETHDSIANGDGIALEVAVAEDFGASGREDLPGPIGNVDEVEGIHLNDQSSPP